MWWDWIAKTEQEAPTLRKPSRPVLSRASNRAIPRETAWVVQQRAPNHHHGHVQATKRHRKKSGRYILVYFSPAVTTWTSIYSYNSSWIFKTIYIQVRKMYILYSYLFIYIYNMSVDMKILTIFITNLYRKIYLASHKHNNNFFPLKKFLLDHLGNKKKDIGHRALCFEVRLIKRFPPKKIKQIIHSINKNKCHMLHCYWNSKDHKINSYWAKDKNINLHKDWESKHKIRKKKLQKYESPNEM